MSGERDLFAPKGGWVVQIIDLSAPADDRVLEEVKNFPSLMQANAFARRYVRDSMEHCRAPGLTAAQILQHWMNFGEDAIVKDAGESGFNSAAEIGNWAQFMGSAEDRDWRALDPRRTADRDETGT